MTSYACDYLLITMLGKRFGSTQMLGPLFLTITRVPFASILLKKLIAQIE